MHYRFTTLLLVALLALGSSMSVQSQTTWADLEDTYRWHAEIPDLDVRKQYYDNNSLLGGINIDQGDISYDLERPLTSDFDLFGGHRLAHDVTIEGDMLVVLPMYSDFHLLVLPLTQSNMSTFELLVTNQTELERHTYANYSHYTEQGDLFQVFMDYEGLSVSYSWNTTTGVLVEKSVDLGGTTILSILPGKGKGFGVYTGNTPSPFFSFLLTIALFSIITRRAYRR